MDNNGRSASEQVAGVPVSTAERRQMQYEQITATDPSDLSLT